MLYLSLCHFLSTFTFVVVTEQDAIGEEATEVRRKEKSIKQEPQTEKRKPESPAPRLTRNKAKKGV